MSRPALIKRLAAMGQGEGIRAQLLRGGAGVGVLRLLSLPLALLATILLARGLGPEDFGQYSFVVAVILAISIPLAPALLQLTTRETAAFHQAGQIGLILQLVKWANRRVMVGSVLLITALGGVSISLAEWRVDDRWTLLLLILMVLPFLGLNAVRLGVLTGLRRVVAGQFPELFLRPVVLLIIVVALYISEGLNPLTAIAAYILAAGAAFIVGIALLKRAFPKSNIPKTQFDSMQRKNLDKAWIPFTLLVAANTLNAQIGILMLGWLSSNEQVAAMQIAAQGSMLVALSLTVVNQVIGPHITQAYRAGERRKMRVISRQSVRLAILCAVPMAIPLLFWGDVIIEIIFGGEYVELAVLPLAIMVTGQLVNVAFGSVGTLLTMCGYERDTLTGQIVALVISVLAAMLLAPEWGATGAALAVAIGIISWNLVLAFLVVRRLEIRPGPI